MDDAKPAAEETTSGTTGELEEAKSAQTGEVVLDPMDDESRDGFVTKMLKAINEAKDEGASKEQIAKMRAFLRQETNWHPTKKRLNKAERQAKRRTSKKSRQLNQRRQRAHAITKGYRKSGRV